MRWSRQRERDDARKICSDDTNKVCHFFKDKFILSFSWVQTTVPSSWRRRKERSAFLSVQVDATISFPWCDIFPLFFLGNKENGEIWKFPYSSNLSSGKVPSGDTFMCSDMSKIITCEKLVGCWVSDHNQMNGGEDLLEILISSNISRKKLIGIFGRIRNLFAWWRNMISPS